MDALRVGVVARPAACRFDVAPDRAQHALVLLGHFISRERKTMPIHSSE